VFFLLAAAIGGTYVLLIVLMLVADAAWVVEHSGQADSAGGHSWRHMLTDNPVLTALADRRIRYSVWLSLISCTVAATLSVVVAVPMGYLLSRYRFPGRRLIDAAIDIPIVLPPLVVGLSLLILFQFAPFRWIARDVVYQVPSVVVAQFAVAAAFAIRTMKSTFDHIDPRCEDVAVSLGCSRFQAFGLVLLPAAGRGLVTAFTLSWARALGEFGPLLIFSGATPLKTEVLSTSVYLEMSVGNLEGAVGISFIMIMAAIVVLILTRTLGTTEPVMR